MSACLYVRLCPSACPSLSKRVPHANESRRRRSCQYNCVDVQIESHVRVRQCVHLLKTTEPTRPKTPSLKVHVARRNLESAPTAEDAKVQERVCTACDTAATRGSGPGHLRCIQLHTYIKYDRLGHLSKAGCALLCQREFQMLLSS